LFEFSGFIRVHPMYLWLTAVFGMILILNNKGADLAGWPPFVYKFDSMADIYKM